MGHSKIYNNDSKYVIANVMNDVENVNTREYLIDFYAKSIYPAIEAMVLKEQNQKGGVLGNEPGEYGSKSHIHYISDSFSISLEDVIKGFKAGICPHSKVHITLDESKE